MASKNLSDAKRRRLEALEKKHFSPSLPSPSVKSQSRTDCTDSTNRTDRIVSNDRYGRVDRTGRTERTERTSHTDRIAPTDHTKRSNFTDRTGLTGRTNLSVPYRTNPESVSKGARNQNGQKFDKQENEKSSGEIKTGTNIATETSDVPSTPAAISEDIVYSQLPTSILDELNFVTIKDQEAAVEESPEVAIQSLLTSLLESNSKAGDTSRILQSKIEQRLFLLDNPGGLGRASERARQREEKAKGKRSDKHLSLAEHRKLGTFCIPRELQKFELYECLHDLWERYVTKLVAGCSHSVLQSRLLTADLHGSIITVVKATDPAMIAINGIVVRESQRAFHVITRQDTLKMVPKKGAVFIFELNNFRVTLYGDHLEARWVSPGVKKNQVK